MTNGHISAFTYNLLQIDNFSIMLIIVSYEHILIELTAYHN